VVITLERLLSRGAGLFVIAVGVVVLIGASPGRQSQSYLVVPDALSSSGGTVGSAGMTLAFSSGEPTVGHSASGSFNLYAGFNPRYFLMLTDTPDQRTQVFAGETALGRGYPNPFSSGTQVSYAVAQDARVRVSIYDVAGRKVRTIEDCLRSRGSHTSFWDGSNEDGIRMSPGVYICVLETNDVRKTQKLVLVR